MNKTTAAADGRFDMQLKTLILKDKMLKDMDQYNGQIGAFQRVIAHNDQLKNFMSIKGTERASQEDNSVDLRKQENEERREKGMDLEMSLKTIQRVTGEIEPQKIVEKFRQGESWSFSLLKFVNEQNNQAEHIRDQISQILKEIDHLKGEWRLQNEEHAGVIRSLSSRQQQVERQRQATEQRSAALNKTLEQLKTGIYSLMQQTNCDRTAIDEQLGASCDNRESMIMAFLGLLEHRTNELLTVQSFLNIEDRKCSVSTTACHLLGKSQPLSQQELSVRPPPPWNESDEAEESELNQEEHVLSRETLHKHALKRMERRRTRPEVKSDSDRISLSTSLRRRSQALGLMSGSRLALP
ncbi:outer dynein arm-docking complex subunit 1-like [Engraulis encrasicolus]|uniref:outer dynein arm-docking complex subunit 1-like n=1 Tax=Engraulis encrasicolus TaxID=184585 RepID=UPI002FD2C8ED